MDLMHHEDSCSDEEAEGHARLMALAAQVATQRGPSQPISQAVRPCHPETSTLDGWGLSCPYLEMGLTS